MTATEFDHQVEAGIAAWQRGDIAALAPLLADDVELLWWEPTPSDCHGKEAVLALLRERFADGESRSEIEVLHSRGDALVVSRKECSPPRTDGSQPATVVLTQGGQVVSMQQFRTREQALASVGLPAS
ncbi:MAG TPA: nuclear transport factor 2 family protein [Candidatus Dormibacteraeota bacterium]